MGDDGGEREGPAGQLQQGQQQQHQQHQRLHQQEVVGWDLA